VPYWQLNTAAEMGRIMVCNIPTIFIILKIPPHPSFDHTIELGNT